MKHILAVINLNVSKKRMYYEKLLPISILHFSALNAKEEQRENFNSAVTPLSLMMTNASPLILISSD